MHSKLFKITDTHHTGETSSDGRTRGNVAGFNSAGCSLGIMTHIYTLSIGVPIACNRDAIVGCADLKERLFIRGVVSLNPKMISD
jgi:hypothetical protein